jgi:hypothetical protein
MIADATMTFTAMSTDLLKGMPGTARKADTGSLHPGSGV